MTTVFIIIVVFAILSLVSWSFLFKRTDGRIIVSLDNIFIFIFQITFCILFPAIFYLTMKGYNRKDYAAIFESYTPTDAIIYYFLINLFLWTFIFAFRYKQKKDFYTPKNIIYSKSNNYFNTALFISTLFILLIGCICNYLFYRAYGGYFNYLPYATMVRAGVVVLDNPFTFLSPLRGCIGIACLLSFAAMIKSKRNFFPYFFIFVISFVLTILNFYANRGRLSIIRFFLCMVLIVFFTRNKRYRISFKLVFSILVLAIISIFMLNIVGNMMGRNVGDSIIQSLCFELSFPFVSFKLELSNLSIDSYRYFIDILGIGLYMLPTRVWSGLIGHTSSQVNTNFFVGSYQTTGGEIPVDIVSFSFMQFGVFGVVFVALITGWFFRQVFRKTSSSNSVELKSYLLVVFFVNFMINDIYYADTKGIAQNLLPLLLFLLTYRFLLLLNNERSAYVGVVRT